MCDNCKGILLLSHSLNKCPLRRILYCTYCASYGHDYKSCNNECRNYPLDLEKTNVSPNDVVTYNVLDNPKAIKAFLKVFDDLPDKDIRGNNKYKKHIKEFEKRRNVKVILYE